MRQMQEFHDAIVDEVAKESPECAARIIARISDLSVRCGMTMEARVECWGFDAKVSRLQALPASQGSGLSYPGHCGGGRDDLEPAYTPGHPLKKLPADWGRSCEKFEPFD